MIDGRFNYHFLACTGVMGKMFFIGNTFLSVVRCVMIMPLGNRNSHPVLLSSVRRQRKSTADSLTHGDGIRQEDLTRMKVCGIKKYTVKRVRGKFALHLERNIRHYVWKTGTRASRGLTYFIASSTHIMLQDAQKPK